MHIDIVLISPDGALPQGIPFTDTCISIETLICNIFSLFQFVCCIPEWIFD